MTSYVSAPYLDQVGQNYKPFSYPISSNSILERKQMLTRKMLPLPIWNCADQCKTNIRNFVLIVSI